MRILGTAFALLVASSAAAQDPAVGEAVDALAQKYADAWKAGDAAACASIYTEDADEVDFMGVTVKGRAAIQEAIAQTLATYKGSTIQISRTGIQQVSPDVVVSDGTWEITGGTPAEGAPTSGFYTVILTKQADGWLIAAGRTKVQPPAMPGN